MVIIVYITEHLRPKFRCLTLGSRTEVEETFIKWMVVHVMQLEIA